MNTIKFAWEWAKLAGKLPNKQDHYLLKTANAFYSINSTTDYGFVAVFKDSIIIAFSGTWAPNTIGGVKAWVSNFDAYPLRNFPKTTEHNKHKYNKHITLVNRGILKNGTWGKGIIHDGFYTAWTFFKRKITSIIRAEGKTVPIYCIGKSRGGALATLCARHLKKNVADNFSDVNCITFGSPAVGVKDFRNQYEHLGIFTTRVTYGIDIVPTLPPYNFNFRHVGNHKCIPCLPWMKWFPLNLVYQFSHHTNKYYQKGIDKHYG